MVPDSSFSTRSRVVCAQDVHRLPWVSTPTFGHPVLAETSVPCRQTCVPSGGASPPHAGEPLTVASLLPLLFPPLPHHAQGALGPWGAGERPEPTSPRHSSFLISSFSSFLLRVSLLPSLPEYLWKVLTIVVRAFSRGVSITVCSPRG